jgi:hypothetical protein
MGTLGGADNVLRKKDKFDVVVLKLNGYIRLFGPVGEAFFYHGNGLVENSGQGA